MFTLSVGFSRRRIGPGLGLGSHRPLGASVSLVSGIANGASASGYTDPSAINMGSTTYVGYVENTGLQKMAVVDNATGSVLSTTTVCSSYSGVQDDHNAPALLITPGGKLLTASLGHNTDSFIRLRRSTDNTPANLGAQVDLASVIGPTTYPQFKAHTSTGDIYFKCRTTQTSWSIYKSTNDGVSFTLLRAFVTNASQMYCQSRWVGANVLRVFANYNPNLSNSSIRVAEIDVVSGDITSGGGVIGNINAGPTSDMNNWSEIALPGTGKAAAIFELGAAGDAICYEVVTNDEQQVEYWYAKYTGGGVFTAANWTKSLIVSGGLGVGDLATPTFRWNGRWSLSNESGLTYPRAYVSRRVNSTFYLERWDALDANGTSWRCTYFFDSLALGTSDALMHPTQIVGADPRLPTYWMAGTYHEYTNFTTALRYPVISGTYSGSPTITSAAAYSPTLGGSLVFSLTASRSCGWSIVGGANAANFIVYGDKLEVIPTGDASGARSLAVRVRATDISGNYAEQDITVSLPAVGTTTTNLLRFSEQLGTAPWSVSNATLTADATLAPDGTTTADRLVQSAAAGVSHRISQTVSSGFVTGRYMNFSIYAKADTVNYLNIDVFASGPNVAEGYLFDVSTGALVGPRTTPLRDWPTNAVITPAANGFFRCSFAARIPQGTTGLIVQAMLQSTNSQSGVTENGNTGRAIFIWGAMLNLGDAASTYVKTV